ERRRGRRRYISNDSRARSRRRERRRSPRRGRGDRGSAQARPRARLLRARFLTQRRGHRGLADDDAPRGIARSGDGDGSPRPSGHRASRTASRRAGGARMNAEALITARFLRAGEKIDWLSTGLTLVAALSATRATLIVSILLGLAAKVYAVRIAFDARVFEDLAGDRYTMAEFDDAMHLAKPERSLADRCRGAKRLVFVLAALTIAQAIVLMLSACPSSALRAPSPRMRGEGELLV